MSFYGKITVVALASFLLGSTVSVQAADETEYFGSSDDEPETISIKNKNSTLIKNLLGNEPILEITGKVHGKNVQNELCTFLKNNNSLQILNLYKNNFWNENIIFINLNYNKDKKSLKELYYGNTIKNRSLSQIGDLIQNHNTLISLTVRLGNINDLAIFFNSVKNSNLIKLDLQGSVFSTNKNIYYNDIQNVFETIINHKSLEEVNIGNLNFLYKTNYKKKFEKIFSNMQSNFNIISFDGTFNKQNIVDYFNITHLILRNKNLPEFNFSNHNSGFDLKLEYKYNYFL